MKEKSLLFKYIIVFLVFFQVLGSVGEPINSEAWLWFYNLVGHGKCSIADTFWQTETGGHVITPIPGATPMKPGSAVSFDDKPTASIFFPIILIKVSY